MLLAGQAARRGIILGGWAKLDAKLLKEAAEEDGDPHGLVEYAAANVLFVDKAPHELVFPKCSVIVHHGGMGTTAASLRSGKPTIITPVLLDQFDAAELVETLGVGKRACSQLLQMTPDELAAAISLATTSEGVQKKAEQVARWIRQENGVEGAVAFIKEQYQSQVVEGKWFDAWVNEQKLTDKSLTASRRTERMMYAAAGFLAGACALMVASRFQVPRWQGV